MTKVENVTPWEWTQFKESCPDEAKAIEKQPKRDLFNSEPYTSTDSFKKMTSQMALNYFVLGLRARSLR